jgi:hypothetical protein
MQVKYAVKKVVATKIEAEEWKWELFFFIYNRQYL